MFFLVWWRSSSLIVHFHQTTLKHIVIWSNVSEQVTRTSTCLCEINWKVTKQVSSAISSTAKCQLYKRDCKVTQPPHSGEKLSRKKYICNRKDGVFSAWNYSAFHLLGSEIFSLYLIFSTTSSFLTNQSKVRLHWSFCSTASATSRTRFQKKNTRRSMEMHSLQIPHRPYYKSTHNTCLTYDGLLVV